MEVKNYYIETYGCQMNVADSELIAGLLNQKRYQLTDSPAEADVITRSKILG
jgi:tRNA-2-methylthio-N6-dimethylallyladenosine synthase